jgi:hypothetical protein
MAKQVHSKPSPAPSGGIVRLQARATDLTSWLGPTWATLCGIVASGGFSWQGQDWLRLALLILLIDGGWGTLWGALGGTDWATPLRRWRECFGRPGQDSGAFARLPYTLPGTPGDHLARLLSGLRTWWREALWPICGSAFLAIVAALPVTAVLGLLLGPELLLLSLAALALMQLGVVWEGGGSHVPPGWDATITIALAWVAGHVTFGPVTLRSAGLAALFTLAWGKAWQVTSSWGRRLAIGSQLLAVGTLVTLQRPLAAGTSFLLLIPQLALLPWIGTGLPAAWYVRYTRPWLMATMATAAFALALQTAP